jgi:hypothetical protein
LFSKYFGLDALELNAMALSKLLIEFATEPLKVSSVASSSSLRLMDCPNLSSIILLNLELEK